jgi:hypothetical protein
MELYTPKGLGIGRRRRRRKHRGLPLVRESRGLWGKALAGAVILSGVGVAVAAPSDAPSTATLLDLLRPVLDPNAAHSLRVGSVLVTPSLGADGGLDTNVFDAPNHEHSDWFASLSPSLDIESDLPRHALSLRAQGELRQYATYSREDTGNFSLAGTGRIDLAGNAYVLAGGGYQLLHEDRGALVPVNGKSPTQYSVTSAKTGFVIEPSPIGLRLDASVDSYAYNNIALFGGGFAEETARDHVVYALEPRISYQIQPQYDAYVRAVVNRRQYNSTREPDALDRSSIGYAADIGSAFGLAGFAKGQFYLGVLGQNYDSNLAKAITTVDFGGAVEWRSSKQTLFRFTVSRSVEESAILGSAGYLQTAVRLAVEHYLLPRIRLDGSLGYINANFTGAGGSSDLYQMKLGARYEVSDNLSAGLEYDVGRRQSSVALPTYTQQIVELRLRGEL